MPNYLCLRISKEETCRIFGMIIKKLVLITEFFLHSYIDVFISHLIDLEVDMKFRSWNLSCLSLHMTSTGDQGKIVIRKDFF